MPEKANWFEIRNAAESPESGPAEILIYGRIGKSYYDSSSIGARDFAEALSKLPQEREILVRLNSPGGNIWDGLAIYHQLQSRRNHVVTQVDGLAASIASVIAMAGRETRIPKNALLMIHDPSAYASGTAAEMRKMAEVLDTHKKVLVGIYHAKSGKPVSEIEAAMSTETWYSGDKAKEAGLADTVTDQVSLTAEFDLSMFRNSPKTLSQPSIPSAAIDSPAKPEMNNVVALPAAAPAAPVAAAAPAAAAETPLTLLEKLKNLLTPASAKAELETVTAGLAAAQTEIANLKAELARLQPAAATAQAAVTAQANIIAVQTLAKAGHTAVTAEDPGKKAPEKTLQQEYNEAKGKDRTALVAKYGIDNIWQNIRKAPGQN